MREKRYEAIPRKARYCRDTSARSTDRRQLLVPDPADQGAASVWPRIISWFGTRATAFASSDRMCEASGVSWLVPRTNIEKSASSTMRSEEHTSELQSLMRISYAVFCLKKKKNQNVNIPIHSTHH